MGYIDSAGKEANNAVIDRFVCVGHIIEYFRTWRYELIRTGKPR